MHPGSNITQVYLCCEVVDFRKSIDGLSAIVEHALQLNPFAASLYVFMNRSRTKMKVLYWHRNGFCLWYKRLEAQRFAWPVKVEGQATLIITIEQFEWLLEGFDIWQHSPHKTLQFTSVS
jgi:transposase